MPTICLHCAPVIERDICDETNGKKKHEMYKIER